MADVIFEVLSGKGGDIGKIVLNRPSQLNALNLSMCCAINAQLQAWKTEPTIKAVIIAGAGDRAFCAGGDIRAIYQHCIQKEYASALDFFKQECAINQIIFNYPKPYIAFLDGITMGGGVGISVHGTHAIASERLIWAMPETGIGFFPDVGVGYHLARMHQFAGFYLGLTGAKINASLAYSLGLVDGVIKTAGFPQLEQSLRDTDFKSLGESAVSQIIAEFHLSDYKKEDQNEFFKHTQRHFSYRQLEEILCSLEQSLDSWSQATLAILKEKSLFSVKLTHKHLINCINMSFFEVIDEDLLLTSHFLHNPDFMAGIRSVIIDKIPYRKWHPSKLENVDINLLNAYFTK